MATGTRHLFAAGAIAAVLVYAPGLAACAGSSVVTNAGDSGPGSLRQALVDANAGDTITFAVTGTIGLTSGELRVDKDVAISGPGANNLAIDGNAKSRVFHISTGTRVAISALTIRNGLASGEYYPDSIGAGIYNDHATLTINDCAITSNSASADGGAIYNDADNTGLNNTHSASLTINSSLLAGNSADDGGGGIYNYDGTLALNHCTITRNLANFGGGLYNDGSSLGNASLTISSSTLTCNSARLGGGIYNDGFDYGDATLTVNESTFNNNRADVGGCIFNDGVAGGAEFTSNDSTLSGNSATDRGGCIYNDVMNGSAPQTFNNSNLNGNSAGNSGGAIYSNHAGFFILNNCGISGNSAQNFGGGIYNDGSQEGAAWLTVNSSTLNANSAAKGGGIFNDGQQQGDTHLQISNSTISGNTADYGAGIASNGFQGFYVSVEITNSTFGNNSAAEGGDSIFNTGEEGQTVIVSLANTILKTGASGDNIFNHLGTVSSFGYNLSNDNCGGYLTGLGDQINTDPLLGPLQNNGGPTLTHALLPGSPAVNTGDPNFAPPPVYDQRGPGFDRVIDGRVDIGSFEIQGLSSTPTPTPSSTPTLTPSPTPASTATPRHSPTPRQRPTPAPRPRPTPHTSPAGLINGSNL